MINLCAEPARLAFAPRPRLRPSEWADRELTVTAGPSTGARWRTTAAQRGIMDVFHVEPQIETAVVRAAAQTGKSAAGTGIVAFHLAHRPTSILFVTATKDPAAYDFSRTRFEPLVNGSKVLSEIMHPPYARQLGAAAKVLLRTTKNGGTLAIAGANSASSLAARSVEVLIQDEVDRWPDVLGDEGSPIDVSRARTDAYASDRKILMLSTPTTDAAPVSVWHDDGDRRRWHVPCPACGVVQPLDWPALDFEEVEKSGPVLRCVECEHGITESERRKILELGEWRATAEPADPTIASFHLSRLDSPFSSLADIVRAFKLARRKQKRGDPNAMNTWRNLWMGEPTPAQVDRVEVGDLVRRRELFEAPAPAGVLAITVGADIQADRIETLTVGWGESEESWILNRALHYGDTASSAAAWDSLAVELETTYRKPDGTALGIRMTAVDAGYLPSKVYAFVSPRQSRVRAVKGQPGVRPVLGAPSAARPERPCSLYPVGDDEAKSLILARLKSSAGPGAIHLPAADWCTGDFLKGLASEALETTMVRGRPVQRWRVIYRRNEPLDCAKYALAARRMLGALTRPKPAPARKPYLRVPQGWRADRY